MICPFLMLYHSNRNDSDSSLENPSIECPKEKCAWWVGYRAPYNSQECAIKHISDVLHQQVMPK